MYMPCALGSFPLNDDMINYWPRAYIGTVDRIYTCGIGQGDWVNCSLDSGTQSIYKLRSLGYLYWRYLHLNDWEQPVNWKASKAMHDRWYSLRFSITMKFLPIGYVTLRVYLLLTDGVMTIRSFGYELDWRERHMWSIVNCLMRPSNLMPAIWTTQQVTAV